MNSKPHILITGGAGYIGSHTNKLLHSQGHQTVVIDNLSTGHKEFLKWGEFVHGDIGDSDVLDQIFTRYPIHTVLHFSASAYVGESVTNPELYYYNNVVKTVNLLRAMRKHEVRQIIFSSSCASYGNPQHLPMTEEHPQSPINPYGWTKFMVERILSDFHSAYGLSHVSLRYFNAAGADPEGELGEWHDPETHLIPLAIEVATGKRGHLGIFGTDFGTADGSCIRDYIHVADLAQAHVSAMNYLDGGGESAAFNLGNGCGYSVKEVIDVVKKITGHPIPTHEMERRPGDPAILVGHASKANKILGWAPKYPTLAQIVASAWEWNRVLARNH